ncbi:MAG: glutamate synthase subunit beta [Dactylosporangium sp.]|nr:glutamate synthase subunit beta [Dactylosporangium sp.]NNJ63884.1 glutamate synthase subunit beta [Dactylosporangium sp.]
MPDPKGFLTFTRRTPALRPVEERVGDWRDVYQSAGENLIREQATRCMDCGIPYCHNGCPLGNVIPDFNDLVRTDRWDEAADVLHATNNFPDFTGRLCPAPCEGACVVGVHGDPVTIKQIEVEIADRAAERAKIVPQPAGKRSGRSVAIVGSGPAGLAAAQQLARAGHDVTVYERDDAVGGLMRYGIPDFKLEKWRIDDRMAQLIAEGVRVVTSCNVGTDISIIELRERHDAVLLTCGAQAARDVPATPGRQLAGINMAMEYLVGANDVVAGKLTAPPIDAAGKHVIVLGGGDTAADCLGTATRQGARSVHLIEVVPQPPLERDTLRNPWPTWPVLLRTNSSHEEGGTRVYGAAVQEFIGDDTGRLCAVLVADVTVSTDGRFTVTPVPGTERRLPADLVLLAIGFAGTEPGPMLDELGLQRTPRGTVGCDEDWQTAIPGVFAAGDMRRGPSLVVWAIAEGRSAAASVHRYLGGQGHLPAPVTPASMPLMIR